MSEKPAPANINTGSETDIDESTPRRRLPCLVVCLCTREPYRVGEVIIPHPRPGVPARMGRRPNPEETPEYQNLRLPFLRQHPGGNTSTSELHSDWHTFATEQLEITLIGQHLEVINLKPQLGLYHNGIEKSMCQVTPGDILDLGARLILLCVERPLQLTPFPPSLPGWESTWGKNVHRFGVADPFGIVGESEEAWTLRGKIWRAARSSDHVLVQGPSRTGKELVARAIYHLSDRKIFNMETIDATHVSESLAELLLVGNIKDFPNPGTPATTGILARSPNGTIFIDEFGEFTQQLQAKLQRFMDYQCFEPLGGKRVTASNTRLILATRRECQDLRVDVLNRCTILIVVPPLDKRREDIPLLARHLLNDLMRDFKTVDIRSGSDLEMTRRTILGLLLHPLVGNMGELRRVCGECLAESRLPQLRSTLELQLTLQRNGFEPIPSPTNQSGKGDLERIFSYEEIRLVTLHRLANFNGRELARNPAYPGERVTANMRMNIFLIRALSGKDWHIVDALALLQGLSRATELDRDLHPNVIKRSAQFLLKARQRVAEHNDEYLCHFWRSYGRDISWLMRLADAIRTNKLVGWEILSSAPPEGGDDSDRP